MRLYALLLIAMLLAACGDDDGQANNNQNNQNVPQCGNGILESGEQCDQGAANSDLTADACRTNCRNPACGDAVVDSGEECDDGNASNEDGCLSAAASAADRCVLNTCGDGWVDTTPTGDGSIVEACDDGNTADGDDCSADCQQDQTTCGNGDLDQGETCDDGAASHSDTVPNTCRTNCQVPWCGDDVVDDEFGESCDGSDLNGATCLSLGLGFVGGTLACTPGTCAWDTTGCVECIPMPEVCDGLDNDCDGEADNGFDTQSDNLNCGSCGYACENGSGGMHLIETCLSGTCVKVDCAAGWADLNGLPSDGCECEIFPEVCFDGVDNNCSGEIDEGC